MIKTILKKTLLTLIVCCSVFLAKAQLGYTFSHYDVGASAGINTVFGDIQTNTTTPSVNLNLTFNYSPFTNFVFEAQLGRMAGGDSVKTSIGRQFTSTFNAFIFRGQLQLGEIMDYSQSPLKNALKNFYVSGGIGYMVTHITSISRYSTKISGLYTGGSNNSQEPFLPFRIGYEFKVFNRYQVPSFKIDLAYGYNYIFSDNLDGYATGKSNDTYSQVSIGVKFSIGSDMISYRKQIQY